MTFGSKFLISRKENKECYQSVRLANNEVIYAIRHLISEEYVPAIDIINSLINANARKFKVRVEDMFTVYEVSEEIIKEIMDTSFIYNRKKDELFKQVSQVMVNDKKALIESELSTKQHDREMRDYKRRMLNYLSLAIGVIVSVMTFANSFSDINIFGLESFSDNRLTNQLILITLIMMITLMYVYFSILFMKRRKESRVMTKRGVT